MRSNIIYNVFGYQQQISPDINSIYYDENGILHTVSEKIFYLKRYKLDHGSQQN